MKMISPVTKGKAKFYYAAPNAVRDNIQDQDLPQGLQKDFVDKDAVGFFDVPKNIFTLNVHFGFSFYNTSEFLKPTPESVTADFQFDNDMAGDGKYFFHVKLKSLNKQKIGCIVSGLLECGVYKWLFIAKFPKLPIPSEFQPIKEDLDYTEF